MADQLSKRTKKQRNGAITPHTAALDSSDAMTGSLQPFFIPGRGVKRAKTLEEATKAVNKEVKQESGDGK